MRKSLLESFDSIYILNLHGNSKKQELCPDGSKDENVFDIMQGVSINIFIKTETKRKRELGKVYYYELYGKQSNKYRFLDNNSLTNISWTEIENREPNYFFVPKNFSAQENYEKGFSLYQLFTINSTGVESQRDAFCICEKEELKRHLKDLIKLEEKELRDLYNLKKDGRNWKLEWAKLDVGNDIDDNKIVPIDVFPFDTKFTYYTGKTNGFLAWPRNHSLRHMLNPLNFSLITPRQTSQDWRHVFISRHITNGNILASAKLLGAGTQFPLYLTPSGEAGRFFEKSDLTPNFAPAILKKIEQRLGEKVEPLELFDYIYAVLHNPAYRERYKEFLKIDFPRIPYPSNPELYHNLAQMGSRLRKLHVMDNSSAWHVNTTYPVSGKNQVETPVYREGAVYINQQQYFGNVPLCAWEFYIGGYQPAQKWLKDRKGHTLSFSDIRHYQEIIATLSETIHIMEAIKDLAPLRD